ncbi:unknown [Megasphaera elsdenii CAG:570]|uniref:Uncharacterized protein n=1 Tax=Megasphaera elsdenii CAG:570 TaxID=1263087 RepID=R7MT41_MEGEL|nr:unknown [Megasphaera elsdenii CAG:570]
MKVRRIGLDILYELKTAVLQLCAVVPQCFLHRQVEFFRIICHLIKSLGKLFLLVLLEFFEIIFERDFLETPHVGAFRVEEFIFVVLQVPIEIQGETEFIAIVDIFPCFF